MNAAGLPRRSGNRHHGAVGAVTESRAGWAVAGLSAGIVGFWLVLGGLGDLGQHEDFVGNIYPNIVFGLAFPVAGALILSRLPGHRLGWLYCLCGLACAVTRRSAQQIVTGALDEYLSALPELDALAEHVPAEAGKRAG